jgi:hypothetical protein
MEQIGVSKSRFSWTGPADVSTARRLTCDGVVLPIFTRGGEPLDAGRRTRVVSSAQRAVVVARDQHCIWSGCRMPARWCEAHHVHHWADGGPTDVDHLGLLCPEHHKAAHSGRFVVTLTGPGQILVRRRRPGEPLYEIRLPSRGSPGQQACLLRDLETDAGRLRQQ